MKNNPTMRSITALCLSALLLAGCSAAASSAETSSASQSQEPEDSQSTQSTQSSEITQTSSEPAQTTPDLTYTFDDRDLTDSWDSGSSIQVAFNGDGAEITGKGGAAALRDGVLTISQAGTYVLSGEFSGSVVVEAGKEDFVHLVLNGVSITCESSAPINIRQADQVTVTLAAGSKNALTDGETYQYDDPDGEEPSAALFSKDDLALNGSGSLTIQANHNNGIQSKDDLRISGGEYQINAVKNGIVGKDSLVISGGSFTVEAQNDGLKSTNDTDEGRGYVQLSGGVYRVTSESDAFQAETDLTITGGEFEVVTAGGSGNSSSSGKGMWGAQSASAADEVSAKGIKAGQSLTISGGTFSLDTSDDSIHSNGSVEITGGTFQIASGDDGVHADQLLVIDAGEMEITQSYEGLEALDIQLKGGKVEITASDDGINAAGGNDGSSVGGRPGQNGFGGEQGNLTISGGVYLVNAQGDGLDSNDSIEMSGGTVLVNGPENSGNGPLDYDSSFQISGGTLIAAGSSGMAQATSSDSTQYAVMYYLDAMESGTAVRLEKADGTEICTFSPSKRYDSVLFSLPELAPGDYILKSGGAVSGGTSEQEGLSTGGSYTGETATVSFTISEAVTYLDSNGVTEGRGFGFGGGFGGGRGNRENFGDRGNRGQDWEGRKDGNMEPPEGFEPPAGKRGTGDDIQPPAPPEAETPSAP